MPVKSVNQVLSSRGTGAATDQFLRRCSVQGSGGGGARAYVQLRRVSKHSEKVSFSVLPTAAGKWQRETSTEGVSWSYCRQVFLYNSAMSKKKVQTGGSATTPTSPPQSWSVESSDQTCDSDSVAIQKPKLNTPAAPSWTWISSVGTI